MKVTDFDARKDRLQELFDTLKVREEHRTDVQSMSSRIIRNRARYESVGPTLGIPWYVVGLIHALEADLCFKKHLHNGDPLDKPTTNYPAGHPPGNGPWTWEVSAADALIYDGFDKWRNWSIPGVLFALESFNGLGYSDHHINSPYLWSFSTHYTKGKFTDDHIFKADKVSDQCGAALLLKHLLEVGAIESTDAAMASPVSVVSSIRRNTPEPTSGTSGASAQPAPATASVRTTSQPSSAWQ